MKRVSMQDVARAAGVSRNTVSLALRSDPQIPLRTRQRIERLAAKLGYVRDPLVGEVMAGMRRGTVPSRVLALVNAHPEAKALERHPTVPAYVAGCRRRAAELGCKLDAFWLHEPGLSGERLCSIFRTRGIRGVLLVGMMEENRIPPAFHPVVEAFPVVVTGVRTRDPGLSFSCVDHHMLALKAFEAALELGYRRPGLVLDAVIDNLIEKRFSAGYRTGQEQLPQARRLRPFYAIEEAREDRAIFAGWLAREQPDVLFTLYHEVADWLVDLQVAVPGQVALIQYEWRAKHADWAGMLQHNDVAGEAAVDMLLGMIQRGESGPPPFPRATLIDATWVPGLTAPPTASGPPARHDPEENI